MITITSPRPAPPALPGARRTGATWVAATGALLLIAAAAVFVGVRWGELSLTAKIGIIGALTGAFLVSGWWLRTRLPATGGVLFHLGALLLPIDLAGLGTRLEWEPTTILLAQGLLGVGAFWTLARVWDSTVLRWAATASMVVLCAGVAGESAAPFGVALSGVALAAWVSGRLPRASVVWAAVAGLSPATAPFLTSVGFADPGAILPLASAAAAAFVLGSAARRRQDRRLAFLTAAALGLGVLGSWAAVEASANADLILAGAVFLAFEVTVLALRDDAFWASPLHGLAVGVEGVVGVLAAPTVISLTVLAPVFVDGTAEGVLSPSPDPLATLALAQVVIAWVAADFRWRGHHTVSHAVPRLPVIAACLTAVTAVQIGTASGAPTGAAMMLAGITMAALIPGARVLPAALVLWAPITAHAHPGVALAVAFAGAVGVAEVAVRRDAARPAVADTLGGAAVTSVVVGAVISHEAVGGLAPAMVAAMVVLVVMASQLDRAGRRLGDVARVALLVAVATAAVGGEPVAEIGIVALVAACLFVIDALRLGDPRVALGASITIQLTVVAFARTQGLSVPSAGLALCVSAIVWSGFAGVANATWRAPFLAAAALALSFGLGIATGDADVFSDALMVAGGLGVVAGVALRSPVVGHVGASVVIAGFAGRLLGAGVTASEAYVAPIALQLWVLGLQRRSASGVDSWTAYVPAIALLAGAAGAERVAGGAGWHALVVGAVGSVAVIVGGWRQLAGPIVTGTAFIVGVTLYESAAALAGMPTWMWMAVGGCVLLAAGVVLERSDTSPLEAGRRVVDVMQERFE